MSGPSPSQRDGCDLLCCEATGPSEGDAMAEGWSASFTGIHNETRGRRALTKKNHAFDGSARVLQRATVGQAQRQRF